MGKPKNVVSCIVSQLLCIVVAVSFTEAFPSSCVKVYPSEYAYRDDSVFRSERASANCRRFPSGLQAGVLTEQYLRCDGTQLRLIDSDIGSRQYSMSSYYEWPARTEPRQLLFTFPTRVNLTTITLHYYSDSQRGLPRLRFTAVPDDFDIWDAAVKRYDCVDVAALPPANGDIAGIRNVNASLMSNVKNLLMSKAGAMFEFSVSEVEFFVCNGSLEGTTPGPSKKELPVQTTAAANTESNTRANIATVHTRASEIVAWALVSILTVICIVLLTLLVLQSLYKKKKKVIGDPVEVTNTRRSKYEMRGNPCYKTTNLKHAGVLTHDYESMRVNGGCYSNKINSNHIKT